MRRWVFVALLFASSCAAPVPPPVVAPQRAATMPTRLHLPLMLSDDLDICVQVTDDIWACSSLGSFRSQLMNERLAMLQ